MGATPLVAALDMGYGHMRAALPLARALGTKIVEVDRAPLAGADEAKLWRRTRMFYELASRLSQVRGPLGGPLRSMLDTVTFIPHLHPYRDLSAPHAGTRYLDRMIDDGLGRGLVAELKRTGAPLVTTFYAPALIADRAGLDDVWCVVTDTDVNRIWAPHDGRRTRIRYLVPTQRTARRLAAYGVPEDRIRLTGFPLPDELVGGTSLAAVRRNVGARIVRLDPEGSFRRTFRDELAHFLGALPEDDASRPPLLTFAVGGAGAQAGLAALFLPRLRPLLEAGRLRVALVAGIRREVAESFSSSIAKAGLEAFVGKGLEIVLADDLNSYFDRFHALLAETDVLWTKPSELTFFAALGLPLVFSSPVGAHERYNRRWAIEAGAGLKAGDPRFAAEWLVEWLNDGTLAAAAWSGFMRLPKFGLYAILEALGAGAAR
ncbi:DUF6938 domain-containing protein [Vulgatibacter incomptus]|uniref:Glycosyltransferase n=1 Tax=Vulgatibacter incomptus TaxID=1391653 RepID=A0A0K1PEZ6_9BACT|nr:hypothetical protein [Vulgatibacter incomptus]AKU91991.1 hypothetical protein AKJ08_2378 [Vulgatibacter incomptus]